MPLGSWTELLVPPALPGPIGTPLTAAAPAPAEPASGEPTAPLCADNLIGNIKLPLSAMTIKVDLPNIDHPPGRVGLTNRPAHRSSPGSPTPGASVAFAITPGNARQSQSGPGGRAERGSKNFTLAICHHAVQIVISHRSIPPASRGIFIRRCYNLSFDACLFRWRLPK